MILILLKPYKIGSKTHPKWTEISFESNTAKRMIRQKKARKPTALDKVRQRIRKQLNK